MSVSGIDSQVIPGFPMSGSDKELPSIASDGSVFQGLQLPPIRYSSPNEGHQLPSNSAAESLNLLRYGGNTDDSMAFKHEAFDNYHIPPVLNPNTNRKTPHMDNYSIPGPNSLPLPFNFNPIAPPVAKKPRKKANPTAQKVINNEKRKHSEQERRNRTKLGIKNLKKLLPADLTDSTSKDNLPKFVVIERTETFILSLLKKQEEVLEENQKLKSLLGMNPNDRVSESK
eukprot:TRINITY_DN4844_c0_g1_i1.p1 TRINITY_DN4844_c0_g1~~TRINITY_DN4844_c0_g1_i1.p1  ORF type:complete len:228 (+),score=73.95 TRINITY_DN4844_c0_g1_i1:148-831(+)